MPSEPSDPFTDNPQWTGFRRALDERGGHLERVWQAATGTLDGPPGPDLRCFRVYDCQGSSVGTVIVQAFGGAGFEIFQAIGGVAFDDILDALDIGRAPPPPPQPAA